MFPVKSTDLEIVEIIEDDILELKVPFPKNYPNTKFKQDNNELAYLKIDFSDSKDYVYLMDFYVYSSRLHVRSKHASKEELDLTKGLGKRILCYAINRLIAKNIINNDTAKLRLYAGGGNCDSEKDLEDILKKFTLSQMDAWIKNNLARHPDIVEDLLSMSKKEKATEICAALNNSKLVKYYEQYGLKVDLNFNTTPKKLDLSYVPMSGYLYNILEKCNSKETGIINVKPNSLSISSRKELPTILIKSNKTKSRVYKPKRKSRKSRKTKRKTKRKSRKTKRKPRKTKSTRRKSNKYKR